MVERKNLLQGVATGDGRRHSVSVLPRPAILTCVLVSGILTVAVLGVGLSARAGDRPAEAARTSPFVGSAACAPCHKREHALWARSNHAHTLETALPSNMPPDVVGQKAVRHPPGKTTFRLGAHGYEARTTGPDGKEHDYPLNDVVGRLRIRMFVTTLPDGRRQVLPGMLEVPHQRWFDYSHLIFGAPGTDFETPPVIAPGDPSSWTGPVRSFGARCAGCHATEGIAKRPEPGRPYGARASWLELGVGCEACHGPGRAHAEAWRKLDPSQPLARIEKLPTKAATDLCLRCHIEHEIVTPTPAAAQPIGGDLFERIEPTLLTSPDRVDPAGRVLELIYEGLPFLTSRCAKAGDLTCTDCHDGHGSPLRGQLRASKERDGLCVRCHAEIARGLRKHAHHDVRQAGARCTNCHMPALTIERGHGAVADHSIGIPRLGLEADRAATDACTWCHQAGLRAPEGAPKLAADALRKAYATWWPDAREAPFWVRALAAARLEREGAAGDLLAVLEDEGVRRVVRASAARLLGRLRDAPEAALLATCRDADSLVRRSALYGLGARRGEAVDAALLKALRDPSTPVRRVAARTALEGWTRVQANAALRKAVLPVLESDCEAAPNDDLRWFRLGAAREMSGDIPGAIEAYTRQTMLDPFAKNIRTHLTRLRKPR